MQVASVKTFEANIVLWLGRREENPRRSKQRGFWLGNLHEKATIEAGSTLA